MEKRLRDSWKTGFMPEWTPRILQVNTNDKRGGAATVAWNLHRAFRQSGLDVRMAVASKSTDDCDIFAIKNYEARQWHSRILLTYARRVQASRVPFTMRQHG